MAINNLNSFSSSLAGWIPGTAIWTAILAGFSITVFLLIFSRPPLKLRVLLPRYSAAIGAGLVVWAILLLWKRALAFQGLEAGLELVAGSLIFLTAIFCNYYIGNISAGFRLEMLINLAEVHCEVSLEEWMALFGKGKGMHYFLEDRLKATLLPWKLAVVKNNELVLTPFGHLVGQINSFLASLFSEKEST